MKLSYVVLAILASFVTAQQYTTADIPSCAISCFESAAPEVGCAVTDTSCQCAKSSDLTEKITPCITDSCSAADALKTSQVSDSICAAISSSASAAASTASSSKAAGSASSTATITATNGTTTTQTLTTTATRGASNSTTLTTDGSASTASGSASGSSTGSTSDESPGSGSRTASATGGAPTDNAAAAAIEMVGLYNIGYALLGLIALVG